MGTREKSASTEGTVHAPIPPTDPPAEETTIHTGIIRLALGIEESRGYWESVDLDLAIGTRAKAAFEKRWFGGKSHERVKLLLANFAHRYDRFTDAIATLHRWRAMDMDTRRALCHWHMQLSDPLYRAFTGRFLIERRGQLRPTVDRDVVFRWVKSLSADRWAAATTMQIATKLIAAATEAGLVARAKNAEGAKALSFPHVTDEALTYLLYLLRVTRFEGTLDQNPFLISVGLSDGYCDQRLRSLSALTYRRMGQLVEIDWTYPSLGAWAEASL